MSGVTRRRHRTVRVNGGITLRGVLFVAMALPLAWVPTESLAASAPPASAGRSAAVPVAMPSPSTDGSALDLLLPSADARRQEQIRTEQLGFRNAEARSEATTAAGATDNASSGDGPDGASTASNAQADEPPRSVAANGAAKADFPSALGFWLDGPLPPGILLLGFLLGLSFLTAAWILHLRARRAKKVVLDLMPAAVVHLPVGLEHDRVALRLLARTQAARTEPAAAASPGHLSSLALATASYGAATQSPTARAVEPRASEVVAELPARFARFTTRDEEDATGAARQLVERNGVGPAPTSPQEVASTPATVEAVHVPVVESEPESNLPRERRREDKVRKLRQRVSLLEGSMLQLLSNFDRLAGRVEALVGSLEGEATPEPTDYLSPDEGPDLGPWSDPTLSLPAPGRSVHPEPFFARLAAQRARSRAESEPSMLDPLQSTQSTATLASAVPAASPAPLKSPAPIARAVQAPQMAAVEPAVPRAPAAPLASAASAPARPASAKAVAAPTRLPAARATAVPARAVAPAGSGRPTGLDSPPGSRAPGAIRVRELVLQLAHRGWDAERIARDSKVPARDVALILKSAGPETRAAEIADQRR